MHSRRALPVQVVPAELLYAPSSSAVNFTQTYPMDYTYNDYNEPLRRRFRAAAHAVLPAPPHRPSAPPSATLDAPSMHPYPPPPSAALRRPLPPSGRPLSPSAALCPPLQVLGEGAALVRPVLRRRARAEWRRWRRASSRILGVHVRGTDKTVAPRVTQHGQGSSPLGSARARLLRLLGARPLVALGGLSSAHSVRKGETEPLDTQPLPRVLERAASKVTASTASGPPGAARGLLPLCRRMARKGARRAGLRRDRPGELPPPLRGAIRTRRRRGRCGPCGPCAVLAGGAPD